MLILVIHAEVMFRSRNVKIKRHISLRKNIFLEIKLSIVAYLINKMNCFDHVCSSFV